MKTATSGRTLGMNKIVWSYIGVTVLLVAVTCYSAVTGSLKVSVIELFEGLFSGTHETVNIIKDLRFPRIIVSLYTGASLAVSGVLLQAVMRNPLADAGVIGISSGAGLFSLLFVSFFSGVVLLDAVIRIYRRGICLFSRLFALLEIRP